MDKIVGRITKWIEDRGFGFIQPEIPDGPEVFVHITKMGYREPLAGDWVTFTVTSTPKGQAAVGVVKWVGEEKDAHMAYLAEEAAKKEAAALEWNLRREKEQEAKNAAKAEYKRQQEQAYALQQETRKLAAEKAELLRIEADKRAAEERYKAQIVKAQLGKKRRLDTIPTIPTITVGGKLMTAKIYRMLAHREQVPHGATALGVVHLTATSRGTLWVDKDGNLGCANGVSSPVTLMLLKD